ncbi:AraC family transcriptional regulator [Streptomyces sp. NBC_01497]|uniref:AraC family transcriptional regulator n=1 Tax=Streptomyces sp. NBC_01497 TaxID=2903885 RepID=UPI002E310AD2|nr:AraC family transcriptional regulator [Streptomyces sp. NBC_01497]
MDPLSDILSSLNVRTGSLSGIDAGGDWALGFGVHEHIKIGVVLSGALWLAVDDADWVELHAGDCYLQSARASFRIASGPGLATLPGKAVFDASDSRIVPVGDAAVADRTRVLGGSVTFLDTTVALLMEGLPPVVTIEAGTAEALAMRPLLELLMAEAEADGRLGTALMAERLTELLFVQAIRAVATDGGGHRLDGWLGALGDERIGAALVLMHQNPARGWTVAELGARAGMSRAAFASRFRALVGMPPLDYLQRWRMLAAGRELRTGTRTVAALAGRWGYGSESSFSNAFKRVTGVSPGRYRDGAHAPGVLPPDRVPPRFRVEATGPS